MKWILLKTADRVDMLRQMKIPERFIDYLVTSYPTTVDPKMRHIVWLGRQLVEIAKRFAGGRDPRRIKEDEEGLERPEAYFDLATRDMSRRDIIQVVDWAIQTRPDLMQMTWNDAWTDSVNWHQELLEKAELEATEAYRDPSKIVFRISNGWTVNRLAPEDCEIEGNLMGHCVGGYSRAVAAGRSEIYSLRDPRGEPHATVEMTRDERWSGQPSGLTVLQIQGKQNREPIKEYKAMLKEWFESIRAGGEEVSWEYDEEAPELDHIRDWEPPKQGEPDEYGIIVNQEDPIAHLDWDDMLERAFDEGWYDRGNYFNESNAYEGADAVLQNFEWNIRDKSPEEAMRTFDELENAAIGFQEGAYEKWNEYEDTNWEGLPHRPDEGDFTDEETGDFDQEAFDKAEEEYYEDLSYHENQFPWYQFINHVFEKLNEMRERFHPKEEPVEEVAVAWYERAVKTS